MSRVYVRRFDHDEARKKVADGVPIAELAAEYGVTTSAVYQAVTPGEYERRRAYSRKWRTGTCESCGGPAMRLVQGKAEKCPDGRVLCHKCRSGERRKRLRFGDNGRLISVRCNNLDCANGERWQPPGVFSRGTQFPDVREGGIHGSCRACLTRARQRYREARKVPCATCGKPCLPTNEGGGQTPRCRACFHKQDSERRRASAEATQTNREKEASANGH